jgi:hypothetical protein
MIKDRINRLERAADDRNPEPHDLKIVIHADGTRFYVDGNEVTAEVFYRVPRPKEEGFTVRLYNVKESPKA